MHEMGLALRIVDAVCAHAGDRRVRVVRVDVGRRVAVLPDALSFCFERACEGTVADGAALEIREIPARARCRACGAETTFEAPWGRCGCGGIDLEWLSGDELMVRDMEVA